MHSIVRHSVVYVLPNIWFHQIIKCWRNCLQNTVRQIFAIDFKLLLSDLFDGHSLRIAVIFSIRLCSDNTSRINEIINQISDNMKTYGIKTDDFLNFFFSKGLSFPDLIRFMRFEPKFVSILGLVKWVITESVVLFVGFNDDEKIDAKSDGFAHFVSLDEHALGGKGLTGGTVVGEAQVEEVFDLFFFLLVLSTTNFSEESATIGDEWSAFFELIISSGFSVFILGSNLKDCIPWLELECIEEGEAIDAFDEILPVLDDFFFGGLPSLTTEVWTKDCREGENFSGLDSGVALSLGIGLKAGIGLIFPPSFFYSEHQIIIKSQLKSEEYERVFGSDVHNIHNTWPEIKNRLKPFCKVVNTSIRCPYYFPPLRITVRPPVR